MRTRVDRNPNILMLDEGLLGYDNPVSCNYSHCICFGIKCACLSLCVFIVYDQVPIQVAIHGGSPIEFCIRQQETLRIQGFYSNQMHVQLTCQALVVIKRVTCQDILIVMLQQSPNRSARGDKSGTVPSSPINIV